jgi:ABC-type multidrug transport system fused ATPase/permease subunit
MTTDFTTRRNRINSAAIALPVKPAPIENDDEQRYRPIEWPLVRRLLSELAPFKKQYAIGIVIGLVHVSLDLLGPQFIRAIINYCTAFIAGEVHVTPGGGIRHVLAIIGFWVLAVTGSIILQRICIIIMTRAGETVQFVIRQKLFNHLQELSMSYFDRTKLGRIISRMTSDINSMREVNVWGIWQIIANGMIMLVAASALAWTSP